MLCVSMANFPDFKHLQPMDDSHLRVKLKIPRRSRGGKAISEEQSNSQQIDSNQDDVEDSDAPRLPKRRRTSAIGEDAAMVRIGSSGAISWHIALRQETQSRVVWHFLSNGLLLFCWAGRVDWRWSDRSTRFVEAEDQQAHR